MVDARKGKKNASQIENIHQLRLLYNRHLQWRFINAYAEDTISFQKAAVEVKISKLCSSVLVGLVCVIFPCFSWMPVLHAR